MISFKLARIIKCDVSVFGPKDIYMNVKVIFGMRKLSFSRNKLN